MVSARHEIVPGFEKPLLAAVDLGVVKQESNLLFDISKSFSGQELRSAAGSWAEES